MLPFEVFADARVFVDATALVFCDHNESPNVARRKIRLEQSQSVEQARDHGLDF
jgi:hypothetical protein